MKFRGIPKCGSLVALPNFAWRAIVGTDIEESQILDRFCQGPVTKRQGNERRNE
jgi:hypothetical protein